MARTRSFLLRLPPELWEEVKRWADDELRSVNGQIEYVLREGLRRRGRVKDDNRADDVAPGADGSPSPTAPATDGGLGGSPA